MKYLKDPLVAFLLIGAAIFVVDAWRSGGPDLVHVGPLDIERLQDQWQAQMGRPPTQTELDGLIDAHVREEIFVREARKIGLDDDDVIIRRRLAQKLTFLTEDVALLEPTTETERIEFFQANAERYRISARYSFSHVYFSPDARATPREDAIAAAHQVDETNWRTLGGPFMLRNTFADVSEADVRKDFGARFAEALANLTEDGWQGPVESAYGYHLVRVDQRTPARAPGYEEVKEKVAGDLDAKRREDANARYYESMRSRYEIEVER
ncbi:MAG: peptidylprolyl isomerase [Gammaproteobacteria bacterium]|nr:peptidylprolyl isomerase [Gammaproteobacteria bacterium]